MTDYHKYVDLINLVRIGAPIPNYETLVHGRLDDVQVRDNLSVETMPVRIADRETKTLRGKEIALVKVVWLGAAGENMTWELESKMRESYPELFELGNFQG